MAKPFHPDDLDALAISEIRPAIGVGGALVWRYTLLFPIAEGRPGEALTQIKGVDELYHDVIFKLAGHFYGITILPLLQGYGLRDAEDPTSIETNLNSPLLVYAAPIAAADRYFETLQEGLRSLLNQGLILLERQDIFLLGNYFRGIMSFQGPLPLQFPATAVTLPSPPIPPS
jgi:hypothetical protein